jgi:hypothetical protein
MGPWQLAQIIIAIFVILFIVAWERGQISATGSIIRDTFKGTPVEQPAATVENAGRDLASSAQHSAMVFSGLLVLFGVAYLGSRR